MSVCPIRVSRVSVLPKIVGLAADELFVREWPNLAGFDQNNAVGILHLTFDEQESFFGDHEAETLEHVGIDNGVGNAGLVFQADKNKSFGGAGTLTADHVAGNLDNRPMRRTRQIDG